MKSVTWLGFAFCSNLKSFPEIFEKMESLQVLCLDRTTIRSLPSSVANLSNLKYLGLKGTAMKGYWHPSVVNVFQKSFCVNNATNDRSDELTALEKVFLRDCSALARCIDKLEALSFLFYWNWNCLNYSYNFINCFNLIKDASSEIVANAHCTNQLIAAASVESVSCKFLWRGAKALFSFPTTEIPAWFNYQSVGSSIRVQLHPGWQNSRFLGFELCIVVESSEEYVIDQWRIKVLSRYIFGSKYQHLLHLCRISSFPRGWISEAATFCDHMLLLYDHEMYNDEAIKLNFKSNSLVEILFEFHLEGIDGLHHDYAKMIKKCGVHLLSIDEEEDPQSSMKFEETDFSGMMQIIEDDDNNEYVENSRMVYTLSRDKGIPFSFMWQKVHQKCKVPSNAVWLCAQSHTAFSLGFQS
ncbi:putative leucine-rich repeat-containing protein [Corchorus capsularis]|uniref:Putative leucine-rich repeat-containing protein n=1 Tax=Corchorus capsularis TaxID=210143 RepID=A0A1R3JM41_COCAP|nr:putative leucine-rich repeat-containing protein [Corchorus capsularis]